MIAALVSYLVVFVMGGCVGGVLVYIYAQIMTTRMFQKLIAADVLTIEDIEKFA